MNARAGRRDYRRVIRPNRSLGRTATVSACAAVSFAAAALAAAFLFVGAWPVSFLIVIEWSGLACVTYTLVRHSRDYEYLHVDDNEIGLARRVADRREQYRLPRYWARIDAYPADAVSIRSHGRTIELGKWLAPDARSRLAEDLRRMLRR